VSSGTDAVQLPAQQCEAMFSVLIPFFMGGNSLPGSQPTGETGLAPNCKLIEGGGGFDDHVECSKKNATSKLLGSMFSVRIAP